MLVNGQFIREEPPAIGIFYQKRPEEPPTPEELFAQSLVTGWDDKEEARVVALVGKFLRLFKGVRV